MNPEITTHGLQEQQLYDSSRKLREIAQDRVRGLNSEQGQLNERDGYNCEACMNRGCFYEVGEDDFIDARWCECMKKRKSIEKMQKSGAYELLQRCGTDNFNVTAEWQRVILSATEKYISNSDGAWFFAGGQTGAGKTHLCTAAFSSFFDKGLSGVYVMWRQEARRFVRSGFAEAEAVDERIDELSSVDVLYIDDLFKTSGEACPRQQEVEFAFEIINARYNKNLPTIISSEYDLPRLAEIDEAIAGRIKEKCREFVLTIPKSIEKNQRLV